MFDNPVFDVAIGLTFIYVLYSLLATTIKEFVATIFSYRGRMLERGIEQMLDGKNYRYFWWHRLRDLLYKKKPSKLLNAKTALFAAKITSHALYKRSAEKSPAGKPSYLSSDTFSDILIDVLNASKNPQILLRDIASEIENIAPIHKELSQILTIYLQQANGDLQRFKLLIENWYDDMMDRVSGWYKKQANYILLIIGFILAITFNVSSIDIVKKLSKDKTARAALVQNAQDYVKNNATRFKSDTTSTKQDTIITFQAAKAQIDSISGLYKTSVAQTDTLLGLGWGDFGYTADSLQYVKDSVIYQHDSIKYYNDSGAFPAAIIKYRDDTLKYRKNIAKFTKDSIAYAQQIKADPAHKRKMPIRPPVPMEVKKPVKPDELNQPKPFKPERLGFWGAILYLLYEISRPVKLIGFLITAFAVSLGAPFWFDLLNKFINLRVSGAKPDDTSSGSSKTATLNQKPQPNSFA